jgi:nitric oxide synthase-interacting protein
MTPEAEERAMEQPPSTVILCPHDQDHPISIKKLIPVIFTVETTAPSANNGAEQFACPSCRKTLSNSLTLQLPKQCGHVVCEHCTDQFVRNTQRCFVCDGKCKEKDLITLKIEGS